MKVNLKNKVVEIENISKLLDIELINDVKIKLDEGHGSTKALKRILCANLFNNFSSSRGKQKDMHILNLRMTSLLTYLTKLEI